MKVISIVWQSYYNMLYEVSKEIEEFLVKVYSARALDRDRERLAKVLEEIKEADLLFLYASSSEAIWEDIAKVIKKGDLKAKIVFLGHDPSYMALSNLPVELLENARKYLLLGGKKNLRNLFFFLVTEALGAGFSYEEPEFIPWEGLYHPKADRIFSTSEEYLEWYRGWLGKRDLSPLVGIIFSRHHWVNGNTEVEDLLIRELEYRGIAVIPSFAYSIEDKELGTKGTAKVIREFFIDKEGKSLIEALIKLIFFFIGSTRERQMDDKEIASEGVELLKTLNVSVFCPITSYYKTIKEWEQEELNLDIAWSVALPEFEGMIEPIFIAAQKEMGEDCRKRFPIEERIEKFVERILRWLELKKIPPHEKRIVFVLHNNPCASVEATVGSAAHLDSLESVVSIMKRMKEVGYLVTPPENGEVLAKEILRKKALSEFRWTTVEEIVKKGGALALVEVEKYLDWFKELPPEVQMRVSEAWGRPPGEYKNGIPPAMVYENKIVITGLSFGNVLVMVQPKRGCAGARCDGQVCKILHDPDVPPPHQYIATYKWISREFKAHCVIHVGTHGNLEFLPGKGVGLSARCFPDICIDTIPHLYIYNADNPAEGTVAKRRSYAVLIDHMQTVLTESGLYEGLAELERLLAEYQEAKLKSPARAHRLSHEIVEKIKETHLDKEIMLAYQGRRKKLSELWEDLDEDAMHGPFFEDIVVSAHEQLTKIRTTQIQDGMHIFGSLPRGSRKVDFIYAIMRYDTEKFSLRRELAKLLGYNLEELLQNPHLFDANRGKSYGAILEEIDRLGKELIKMVLEEEGRYEYT